MRAGGGAGVWVTPGPACRELELIPEPSVCSRPLCQGPGRLREVGPVAGHPEKKLGLLGVSYRRGAWGQHDPDSWDLQCGSLGAHWVSVGAVRRGQSQKLGRDSSATGESWSCEDPGARPPTHHTLRSPTCVASSGSIPSAPPWAWPAPSAPKTGSGLGSTLTCPR